MKLLGKFTTPDGVVKIKAILNENSEMAETKWLLLETAKNLLFPAMAKKMGISYFQDGMGYSSKNKPLMLEKHLRLEMFFQLTNLN